MTTNKQSTRYYSQRQEKAVAKKLKGKIMANSGAPDFVAGDVQTDEWLIECKTTTGTTKASFSIKQEWLNKNREEMFAMGKSYNALCFDYGIHSGRYYVVDERTFLKMKEALEQL